MKVLISSLLLIAAGVAGPARAGDPVKDGLRLYKEGKFEKAATAFRKALVGDSGNAGLNYNLALALWRSGDAGGAETAAEKASALAQGEFDGLRDGILGNLRYDKARALADAEVEPQKEVEQLENAVKAAGTARNHFERSVVELFKRSPAGSAEVQRNLERAIKLEEELKKRLEDAKKKQKEQQQKKPDDKDKKEDPNKKKDDKKDEKKDPTQDDKKDDDKKQDPNKQKEQPEPDPKKKREDEQKDDKKEKKPEDEEKNKPHDPGKPQEVPGEHDPNKQLTPEQRRELLKKLEEFDKNLKKLKAARKAARPKVKKDW